MSFIKRLVDKIRIPTQLYNASKVGDAAMVQTLLADASNVNAACKATALITACTYGRVEASQVLLDKGAEVNAKDADGWTALMWASSVGVVDVLLRRGANVNARTTQGETALMIRAYSRYSVQIVRLLLDNGADVNAKDSVRGNTALIRACSSGNIEVVRMLLEKGADLNAQAMDGRTALNTMWKSDVNALLMSATDSMARASKEAIASSITSKPSAPLAHISESRIDQRVG
jgi:ankyrin repeat protein